MRILSLLADGFTSTSKPSSPVPAIYACPRAHLGDGKVKCQESCTHFTTEYVFALINQIFYPSKGILAILVKREKGKPLSLAQLS